MPSWPDMESELSRNSGAAPFLGVEAAEGEQADAGGGGEQERGGGQARDGEERERRDEVLGNFELELRRRHCRSGVRSVQRSHQWPMDTYTGRTYYKTRNRIHYKTLTVDTKDTKTEHTTRENMRSVAPRERHEEALRTLRLAGKRH